MPAPKTSQTIAMNIRHLLYVVTPGSTYSDHRNTAGGRPACVEYTPAERADAERQLADALIAWGDVDPEGRDLWEDAFQGDADADPCAFCASCRRARARAGS